MDQQTFQILSHKFSSFVPGNILSKNQIRTCFQKVQTRESCSGQELSLSYQKFSSEPQQVQGSSFQISAFHRNPAFLCFPKIQLSGLQSLCLVQKSGDGLRAFSHPGCT